MTVQIQGPRPQLAQATWWRLGSLVFSGGALGLRLARLDSPVLAAVVTAGVLAFLGLLLGAVALAARRRVARAAANWPGAVAISASVNIAAMTAGASPPARRKFQRLTVTAVLLSDRLVLVPPRSKVRRGAMAERTIAFSHLRAASWSTGYVGLRQIPILQLTGASGDQVEIRLDSGTQRATADFIAATNVLLAQRLPASALTDFMRPVKAALPTAVGIGLAVTLIVFSVGGGYVAGAAIIANARAPYATRWIRPDREIGVSGYYTYGGPRGWPIQPGAPWGRPCKPILVRVAKDVPDTAYQSFVEVVHEARAAGVDIAISTRDGLFMPSELYPPGQHVNTVAKVDVYADNRAPTRLASGALDHFDLGWDAAPAPDGHHEYVTDLDIKLHLSVLATDATGFRKAALGFVGFTQGVGVSTLPGSAFAPKIASAADQFSAQDIRAMLTMSGCAATSPAAGQ